MPIRHLTLKDVTIVLTEITTNVTISLTKLTGGQFVVDIPQTKDQIIEDRFSSLQDKGISLTEAEAKYNIPRYIIRTWVYRDDPYVNFIDRDAYPQLVNEAEVAVCAEVYRQRKAIGLTGGSPYFDDFGYPITKRQHPKLAEYRRRKKTT